MLNHSLINSTGRKTNLRLGSLSIPCTLLAIAVLSPAAHAATITPDLTTFAAQNDFADGNVAVDAAGLSFVITGGNTGSGLPGTTYFRGIAPSTGLISFSFLFDSTDVPGYDHAGYVIDGTFFELTTGVLPDSGLGSFSVNARSVYGFYVYTDDNQGEPGVLSVRFDRATTAATPEPRMALMLPICLLFAAGWKLRRQRSLAALLVSVGLPALSFGQTQNHYTASNVTGQLTLVRTVNLSAPQHGQTFNAFARRGIAMMGASNLSAAGRQQVGPEISKLPANFPHPPLNVLPATRLAARGFAPSALLPNAAQAFGVSPATQTFGFQGLSHYDQRMANSGNQFSVEPPNPAIAVANGYVLEGVNNAVRVFNAVTGAPLTATISSNELFGVTAAIDRTTGVNGVYPTDMRVFYDGDVSRWFVLQRAQDNDIFGNPLDSSQIYLAVSQTADPTASYSIYIMNTTDASNSACPCVPDFPQIGADQYGFYISANEYNTFSQQFVNAEIFAISKVSLASGVLTPSTYRFVLPRVTGFEFTIQPASAPPGGSQFLGSGGVEYFVSSQSALSSNNQLAVWALSNTAALQSANANLLLTQISVTTQSYSYPDLATQKPGPLPYGSSLSPAGTLEFLDGGSDSRILSLAYAGGRLFATLATQISDDVAHSQVGAAYMILSPTFRNGVLAASVVRQGTISVTDNHVLRPAIAVNAQGKGAIAFTLVGPAYYPSAAYVTLDTVSTSSTVQISAPGVGPEDGFTGYPGGTFPGIARWGDYSGAVVGTDGAVWLVTEYIPGGPRTTLANWGTYVGRYLP